MDLVILESPFSGYTERNKRYLQRCIRDCIQRGESPYASHQMLTDALDDNDPEQRKKGIEAGFQWHEVADKAVVYEDYGISDGMVKGIGEAKQNGLDIEYRSIGSN